MDAAARTIVAKTAIAVVVRIAAIVAEEETHAITRVVVSENTDQVTVVASKPLKSRHLVNACCPS